MLPKVKSVILQHFTRVFVFFSCLFLFQMFPKTLLLTSKFPRLQNPKHATFHHVTNKAHKSNDILMSVCLLKDTKQCFCATKRLYSMTRTIDLCDSTGLSVVFFGGKQIPKSHVSNSQCQSIKSRAQGNSKATKELSHKNRNRIKYIFKLALTTSLSKIAITVTFISKI